MITFYIRPDENEFYCTMPDDSVIWADTVDKCEQLVKTYAAENGYDMYRLKIDEQIDFIVHDF